MKKKAVGIIIVLILIVSGVVFYNKQGAITSINKLTLYGNVDIREVQLTINGSEHIAEIFVQEGDKVKKGQLLATLDTELLEAQLAQVKALQEAQQQIVNRLKAGNRKQEIAKSKAEYKAVRSEANIAKNSATRLQKLLPRKLASADDVEVAQAKSDIAIAQAEAAHQAWLLMVEGPRAEDIALAEAVLLAKKADVQLATQRLKDAQLVSPSDGVIRNRILEPGDMVMPQSAILTLALVDPVWVRAYLPETELGKISAGFNADIISDSFPEKRYQGWVGYISPTAEFTPKNVQTPELRTRLVYSIRVYACNPDNELRLGMPVTVHIPLTNQLKKAASNQCNAGQ
jgi:HlyD family secretion protein